ncbi:hypothetical protein JDV02_009016 [Purpureocillium takamizusanense]|uniref:Uncharacterized protein n=1 Tax=Purpureocillium takamizusanense TaxID=2060973 RepID=A0A9Q8VF97_9HYPO|nr:uncharacterized protein JDV02_009016 [Purpureocillium takamizusanense]UNI23181.1 hypothetical protein JDV02_009016 [Purpureocillium takamizusanense]
MANNVFYFYFAPTWDWPPDGPIKLGNVLTSIKKPEQPLYTAPLPAASEVFSSEKTEVEYSQEKLAEGNFSILTKFLSILGVGVDVGADWQTRNEEYAFERVITMQFVPKEDYIQTCIETEAVRRYLDRSRYRKPLYVITGIKTVYGAKVKSHKSRAHSGKLGVSVDGTLSSGGIVPVSLEPGVGGKSEARTGTSWEGSSDFVFAFRVRKIHVSKKPQTIDKNDDYNKGALLDGTKDKIEEDFPDLLISLQEDPKPEDEGYLEGEFIEGKMI